MKWLLMNEMGKYKIINATNLSQLPSGFSIDADGLSDVIMAVRLNEQTIEEMEADYYE